MFSVLFKSEWRNWIFLVKFRLLLLLSLFFGCSLEFLSVTIDSAYRRAVFYLDIPSCFFLHTKLSIYHSFPVYFSLSWEIKSRFLVCVGWKALAEWSGDINTYFEFKLIFSSYFFFLPFRKKLVIFCWTFELGSLYLLLCYHVTPSLFFRLLVLPVA